MNKLLAFLAIAPAMCSAQSLSAVYDFKSKAVAPVTVVAEQRLFNDLFGQSWFDVDALAFAGASFAHGRAPRGVAGGALAIQPQIADNLWLQIGLAGRIEAATPIITGILAGIKWKVAF